MPAVNSSHVRKIQVHDIGIVTDLIFQCHDEALDEEHIYRKWNSGSWHIHLLLCDQGAVGLLV